MTLLQVLNAEQTVERMERQHHTADETPPDPNAHLVTQLDDYVESCWQAARQAKEVGVEMEMLQCLRARQGEYDPDKLAAIKQQGGSEIYMLMVNDKCRVAEAWLHDVLFPAGERPYTVKPSPVPDDLPQAIKVGIVERAMAELEQALQSGTYVTPEQVNDRSAELYDQVQQQVKDDAKQRAKRMEDAVDDTLVEGGWYKALEEMLSDVVTYPTAFVKGPVIRRKRTIEWKQNGDQWAPEVTEKLVPTFYCPSPLDIYPAADSKDINDGPLCERMRLRRGALHDMIGVPGYSKERIEAALEEYQHGGTEVPIGSEQTRRDLEQQSLWRMTPDKAMEAMEFNGSVRGQWLIEWGMTAAGIDLNAEYEVTCLKVGRFTVRCVLNEDPLRRRKYMSASYASVKGSVWGHAVPWLMRDVAAMCNACARALANNMGIASGPMVEVEVDRLAEGEDVTQLYPWRIFQTKASKTTPAPAVRYNQPNPIVDALLAIYQYFSKLGDESAGIPNYAEGVNPTKGAAGTASGLAMLMNAATRQIKRVLRSIDGVVEGSVSRTFEHLMLYSPNQAIKGDAHIRALGASSLIVKEQMQVRRREFMQATANPVDGPIIGTDGRAEMLRETLRSMDIDPDKIIPSEDEMRAMQKSMAGQQLPPESMNGDQAQTLEDILSDLNEGQMTPRAASAAIRAAYPQIPPQQVATMTGQVAPQPRGEPVGRNVFA